MKPTLLLIFGLYLLSAPALAEEANAATFLAVYDAARPEDKAHLRNFVEALQNGVAWANAALKFQKQKPLYCEPEKLALTAEQVIDLIRKEVQARPSSGMFPWPAVMIRTLQNNFPCSN